MKYIIDVNYLLIFNFLFRSEDLRRYQQVVLNNFDYKEKRKAELDDLTKQKIKFYGQQATDSMLRPGQVRIVNISGEWKFF